MVEAVGLDLVLDIDPMSSEDVEALLLPVELVRSRRVETKGLAPVLWLESQFRQLLLRWIQLAVLVQASNLTMDLVVQTSMGPRLKLAVA